jgi:WD40 repeat protein/tRNA A-37 threonylcarbamoyl transferase component Bud32
MTEDNKCPGCGDPRLEETPVGLCSACLMKARLAAELDITDSPTLPPSPTTAMAATAPIQDAATLPPNPVATAGHVRHTETQVTPRAYGTASLGGVRYFGDYELVQELARGGMGVVYKARQVTLNRIVALKMILAGQLASDEEVRRFYLEAEAAANLDHPGIVPIYEVGKHEGQHYFSMGFVEGQSLAQRVSAGLPPPREAASLLIKVAEAVQYAHDRGVIHRDLKPANVLLDAQGRPRVTDFGLAKKLQSDSGLTATGQVMGTPSYMPPEQASGKADQVGPPADTYSLGAVLYCLLTGRPPFQASNTMDTLLQVLERDPVPLRQLNNEVPPDLETICLKCLEKEPTKRYTSAGHFAADLERWLDGRPILARRVSVFERAWRWSRRRKAAAALLVVSLLGVSMIAALVAYDFDRTRKDLATITKVSDERENARRDAVNQTIEAEKQKTIAQNESKENRRRLVRMDVANGIRLVDDGKPLFALPWFVHALKNEPDGERAERGHRTRIAALLGEAPELTTLDTELLDSHGGGIVTTSPIRAPRLQVFHHQSTSPDGNTILTTSGPRSDSRSATADRRRGEATVWDAKTNQPIFTPLQLPYRVMNGAFTPDSTRFVTVMETDVRNRPVTSELRLWDAKTGTSYSDRHEISLSETTLSFNADGTRLLVCGSPLIGPSRRGFSQAILLDGTSLKSTNLLDPKDHRHAVFLKDGKRLLARADTAARIYDVSKLEPLTEPMQHTGVIETIANSPDGQLIVLSGAGSITIWDAAGGRPLIRPNLVLSFLAFSPDSRHILTKSPEGAPQVWELDLRNLQLNALSPPLPAAGWSPTIRMAATYMTPMTLSLSASFQSDSRHVRIDSTDPLANRRETRVWRLREPSNEPRNSVVQAGLLTPQAGRILDKTESRPSAFQSVSPAGGVSFAAKTILSPNGRTFLTVEELANRVASTMRAGPNGKPPSLSPFRCFDLADGNELGKAPPTSNLSAIPFYSGDGRRVAVVTTSQANLTPPVSNPLSGGVRLSSGDFEIRVYDIPGLTPVGPAISLRGTLGPIGVSQDGRRLALMHSPTKNGPLDVNLWDMATGQPIGAPYRIPQEDGNVSGLTQRLVFSPNDQRLLCIPSQRTAYIAGRYQNSPGLLLDSQSLRPVGLPLRIPRTAPPSTRNTIAGDSRAIEQVAAFSADSRFVALADGGDLAQIFEVESGKSLGQPLVHSGRINWISFRQDGRRVLTASLDGTARVWDSRTGRPTGPPMRHGGGVMLAEFFPDGGLIVTAAWDQCVRIWDAESAELIVPARHLHALVSGLAFASSSRCAVFSLEMRPLPIVWDVPLEHRPVADLESLSVVLSGHKIDEAQALVPATVSDLSAARTGLIQSDPTFFKTDSGKPSRQTK